MPIPDLLKPSDYEFYRKLPMPEGGWPDRETTKALRKSDDIAHDNIKQLVRENDRLRAALIDLHRKQRRWIKILLTCFVTLAGAVASLFAWLIPFAVKGMAK